ncbi:MAG TPA: hypothetical protein VEX15_13920 [Nocardioidaceae bacterium]|nr:hypothetical protein [Nocardioidaceae bacterium]
MWTRKSRTLLTCAVIVVTLAVGWWQQRDEATDTERIASIDGIAAAEYKPGYWYEITLEPGLSTEQVRDVLAEISASVESAEDRDGLPTMLVESAGSSDLRIDLSDDLGQTAAIITSITTTPLTGFDVDLTGLESSSEFGFASREEVLPGALHFVSSLGRAGVDDLSPMGEDLGFYYTAREGYSTRAIELSASPTDVALRQLDVLARSLRLSDAELIRADGVSIEVAIPKGSPAGPVRRVFTAAYGKHDLDLTVSRQAR